MSNDSEHSTVTVDNPASSTHRNSRKKVLSEAPISLVEPPKQSRRRRRRVRFGEKANKYYSNTKQTAEDCVSQWYGPNDYREFRCNVRDIIDFCFQEQDENKRHGQKHNINFYVAMRTLYLAACQVDYVLDDASACLKPQQKAQLSQVYQDEQAIELFLGMEYNVISSIKKDARRKRESVQDVVYEIQNEFDRGLWPSRQAVELELQESCANFTQAPCLFAQLLAIAQHKCPL